MNKKIIFGLGLLISVMLIGNVLAITGSIGNARMVLRGEVGETIEKYVLVKNINDVSVKIEVNASGDLEKYVTIKDSSFTLAPGEEKEAHFTIKAVKEGTTETKIDVKFIPIGEKNGVGLSSTVVFIAGEGLGDTGQATSETKPNYSIILALIVTIIIALVLIILVIIALKKSKAKLKKKVKVDE